MNDAVLELCQFSGIPTVGCTYKVTGDSLEGVDVLAVAVRALVEVFLCVLKAAVKAAVAVVVYRAVADVVLVHEVYNLHDGLRVVGGIAVNFYVENVACALVFVIRSLYLGLVLRGAVIVNRNMAGVGVVVLVRNSGQHAEGLLVPLGELACEPLRRCGEA